VTHQAASIVYIKRSACDVPVPGIFLARLRNCPLPHSADRRKKDSWRSHKPDKWRTKAQNNV
jgi:hypothetical protein